MKSKLPTLIFGITTVILGITTCLFFMQVELCKQTIADRELTITNYKKVINAVGRSGGISFDKLITELKSDFRLNDSIEYNDFSSEYYYVLYPKNKTINKNEFFDFIGLELVLDAQKDLKTVNLYKP